MALDFNGTTAYAKTADNAVANVDADSQTYAFWVNIDDVTGLDVLMSISTATGGDANASIQVTEVSGGTSELRFNYNFDGTDGAWLSESNIGVDAWHHILIAYDRSNIANNPTMYIDGVLQAGMTEASTPVGAAVAGGDTIQLAVNAAGTGAFLDCMMAEVAIWAGDKSALAPSLAKGYSPAFFLGDLKFYRSFIRNLDGPIQSAPFTLVNATVVPHPRIIYPSTKQLRQIINHDIDVAATTDSLILAENAASVKVDRNVLAAVDALTITANAATVNAAVNIVAGVDTLSITANAALVSAGINVTAGIDVLSLTANAATVKVDRNVLAGVDALAITEYAATVNAAINVAAGTDALTITANAAAVSAGINVLADTDALTLTAYAASINAENNVQAGFDALLISTYDATVDVGVVAAFKQSVFKSMIFHSHIS